MAKHEVEKEIEEQPFVFEEAYADLAQQMRNVHFTRASEMPNIELYLDQVLSLISEELAFMYAPDEKIITGAMVNNYVKQKLVLAPSRKRYTRRHLVTLLFVCAFKRVLSIAQIEQIILLVREQNLDLEVTYDTMVDLIEKTVAGLFPDDPAGRPTRIDSELVLLDSEGNRIGGSFERMLENAVVLLAYKVQADRMLDFEARRLPKDEE